MRIPTLVFKVKQQPSHRDLVEIYLVLVLISSLIWRPSSSIDWYNRGCETQAAACRMARSAFVSAQCLTVYRGRRILVGGHFRRCNAKQHE